MDAIFKKEYTLRAGDFDKFDRIKPSAILDLFQDAAGRHSNELGVGFADMLKKSYLWVLTRIKFQILSAPARYDTVIVKTWPLKPNHFSFQREYCVENQNGEKLIIGSSDWVIIHSQKRKLLSVPDLYPLNYQFNAETVFENKLCKIHDFDITDNGYTINAGFSDLDMNGHVNNTNYANYIMNAINPSKTDILKSFQIDYKKEVMQDTKLKIHIIKNDNCLLGKGQNANQNTMFTCEIYFK